MLAVERPYGALARATGPLYVYSRRFTRSASGPVVLSDVRGQGLQTSERDESTEETVPWTREQVAALRVRSLPRSPWQVLAWQTVVGLLCAAVGWAIGQRWQVPVSVLAGAAVVILPGAVAARGISRRRVSDAGSALLAVMVWEALKIGMAIIMLLGFVRFLPDLSWLGLLVGMIACQKVVWMALLPQRRRDNTAGTRD